MTTEPKAVAPPAWATDSSNIADLLEWLDDAGELPEDLRDITYVLRKPWKWDKEYQQMRAEQAQAEADAREERARR